LGLSGARGIGVIALSLGEAEALLRKAARGAGRSWGMAEEFGRALRWLEGSGLAAMALAADLLAQTDGMADAALAPTWGGQGGLAHHGAQPLCPIALGAALSDHANALGAMGRIGPVLAPLLVLPHMADIARRHGQGYAVTWGESRFALTARGALGAHNGPAPAQRLADWVAWGPSDTAHEGTGTRPHRAQCPSSAYASLNRLAERTFAPETEARRQSGAGEAKPSSDAARPKTEG
jgi:hypothetical protein